MICLLITHKNNNNNKLISPLNNQLNILFFWGHLANPCLFIILQIMLLFLFMRCILYVTFRFSLWDYFQGFHVALNLMLLERNCNLERNYNLKRLSHLLLVPISSIFVNKSRLTRIEHICNKMEFYNIFELLENDC